MEKVDKSGEDRTRSKTRARKQEATASSQQAGSNRRQQEAASKQTNRKQQQAASKQAKAGKVQGQAETKREQNKSQKAKCFSMFKTSYMLHRFLIAQCWGEQNIAHISCVHQLFCFCS